MTQIIEHFAPFIEPTFKFDLETLKNEIQRGMVGIGKAYETLKGNYLVDDSEINPEDAYLQAVAEMAYCYGVKGKLEPPCALVAEYDAAYLDLSLFCKLSRSAEELGHGSLSISAENVFAMCILRSRLDASLGRQIPEAVVLENDEELFTLKEVAILAQMHEKSVRNATQPTANDRLETIKVGKRTYVTAKVADDWLSRRRSFQPTISADS